MTPPDITKLVIAGSTLSLLLYSLLMGHYHGVESTISFQMYDLSRKFPIIPFGFGVLCGHVFWPICWDWLEAAMRFWR